MTSYYQEFDGKFSITSANDGIEVGGVLSNLGHFTRYLSDHVTTTLQVCIRAIPGQSTATATYNRSTGKVTITLDSAQTLEFVDSDAAGIFGFTSTSYASATTFTSETAPRQVWRPSLPASDYPNNVNIIWEPKSTSQIVLAEDGTVFTLQGNKLYDGYIGYSLLPDTDIITANTGTLYQDLQQWFEDVIHEGNAVRIYTDRVNSSHYITGYIGKPGEIGSFAEFKSRHLNKYNGLWDVDIPLVKDV